jgi:hypothetical protein
VKFKTVFQLFNIILIVFLVLLCLVPTLLMGASFASTFWQANWFMVVILALILIAFDTYFIINRRLYILLEKGDWPALVQYLEEEVIRGGKYSPHLVRLLANTYLVLSDSPSVMSLENKAAIAKPSLVDSNALVFGTARILGRDISGAVRFFETRLERAKASLKPWIRWYYGFSLLLDKQFLKASEEFKTLALGSSDGVIAGLSSFFLEASCAKALPDRAGELEAVSAEGKARVLKFLPRIKDWARETGSISTEIHAAALANYMEKCGDWLYSQGEQNANI